MSSSRSDQRGFGLIEILLVLVVVAIAGALLYRYFAATARTVETIQEQRPLATSKLAADQATLDSVQGVLRAYYAEHGRWPIDKAAVLAIVPTYQPAHFGRAYAAYGGVFVLLAILWGWGVDRIAPDRWDVLGGALCLGGVAMIMYWPR